MCPPRTSIASSARRPTLLRPRPEEAFAVPRPYTMYRRKRESSAPLCEAIGVQTPTVRKTLCWATRACRPATSESDAQRVRLVEADPIRVFTDAIPGKRFERSGLTEFMDHARPGEQLCVTGLDRLGSPSREFVFHALSTIVQLRAAAHLRTNPRRHGRREKTRTNTGPPADRCEDGFGCAQTHRSGLVVRPGGKQPGIGRGTACRISATMREGRSS